MGLVKGGEKGMADKWEQYRKKSLPTNKTVGTSPSSGGWDANLKTSKKPVSEAEKLKNRIANYETRFKAVGEEPPRPEQKKNLLLTALDVLDRPRNAVVSAVAGKGFLPGLTGQVHTNVSDLLTGVDNKYLRTGLGFAGDVLADPLTYLTFGTAGVAKGVGTGIAREALGQGAKRTALKFAGMPIADVTPITRGIGNAVQKTKAYEAVAPIFNTKAIRRSVTSASELPDVRQAFEEVAGAQRLIKGQQQEAIDLAKQRFKGMSRETAERVPYLIEAPTILKQRGITLKKPALSEVPNMIRSAYRLGDKPTQETIQAARTVKDMIKETTQKDIQAGVAFAEIPNYIKHAYYDSPERVQQVLSQWQKKRLAAPGRKAGFQKERTMPTIKEAEAMGLKPIKDARVLATIREMEGIRQRGAAQMYANLEKLGQNVVREAGNAPAGWKTFAGVPQLQGKAVHPEVARALERFNSTMNTDEGMRTFISVLSGVQGFWKGLVTAPNLSFHIRNAMSNVFNNFLGGVVNPAWYAIGAKVQKGGNDLVTLNGKQYTAQELRRLFRENGLEGFGFFAGESQKGIVREAREAFEKAPTIKKASPIRIGRKVGDWLESNAKMAHFLDRLSKGDTVKEAADSARKYLFDYGDLTTAEKKIRDFIPFYTFTRKNLPLQLESLITQPGKMTALNKLVQNSRSAQGTQESDLPEWMRSELAIPIGDNRHLLMDLPINQLNMLTGDSEVLKNALGMLTPLAKVPIELGMGKQIFSGADIEKYPGAKARYGNVELPAKAAYALSQLGGVPRSIVDIGGYMMPQQPAQSGYLPPAPRNFPVLGTFVRQTNPERERMLNDIRRERQLADYRKYLEEVKGITVPTIAELEKSGKKRGYVY